MLVVLGFLGCCGTWKQKKWMLYLFAFLLSLILIAEVAASIYAIVEREKVSDQVNDGLEKTAVSYKTFGNDCIITCITCVTVIL